MIKRDKTIMAVHRLEGKIYYEDNIPHYEGRPIICKDSPVDGGVSIGQYEREAIVVDSQKSNSLLSLYEKAKKRAMFKGQVDKALILLSVFKVVSEKLKYDSSKVEKIVKKAGVKKDKKINLENFVKAEAGICTHQALLCGVLLELFIKDKYLRGKVSVDRNSVYRNGHAWCRYTTSGGKVFIMDVANDFMGSLEKGLEKGIWCYNRAEDGV